MPISPFYAGILALVYLLLSVRVLRLRRTLQIAIGDDGNPQMLRAMRVHSNFAEYTPVSLLLIFMFESAGSPPALTHVLCVCLLLGRLLHAYGVSRTIEDFRYRVVGMALTFTVLAGSAVCLLVLYAWQLVS